jgi:hypothetical protein
MTDDVLDRLLSGREVLASILDGERRPVSPFPRVATPQEAWCADMAMGVRPTAYATRGSYSVNQGD